MTLKSQQEMDLINFLSESNAIEGVHGEECLDAAIDAWDFMRGASGMSEYNVLETHRRLMEPVRAWDRHARSIRLDFTGKFRDDYVFIGGRRSMNAIKIRSEIEKWSEKMNDPKWLTMTTQQKELMSRKLHVEYEKIHPFFDGNGRTGRIFMNWHRVRNGLPLLIIHTGDEQMEYYGWFHR